MIETLRRFDLSYLATPYRLFPRGHEMAFIEAARLAAKLMQMNIHVYSPIAHGHPLSRYGDIPKTDLAVWNPPNFKMARKLDALVVGMLESWEKSDGIAEEIQLFKSDHKPIFYLDPNRMEVRND